jgi:hypothetical protein
MMFPSVLAFVVLAQAAPLPTLELGKAQVREGRWNEAVLTLDAAINDLAHQVETHRPELVSAWVHKGWALVELEQEDSARACFRAALQQDPKLRLSPKVYPRNVVDVFDSMRPDHGKGGAWDPVKIGITAGLAGLGTALAVGAAQDAPQPEPNPFADYYGTFGVRFAYRDVTTCVRARAPLPPVSTLLVLSGNSDGSGFAVGMPAIFLTELGAPVASSVPGNIQRNGTFTASVEGLSMAGTVELVVSTNPTAGSRATRRLVGTLSFRGCEYTFQP